MAARTSSPVTASDGGTASMRPRSGRNGGRQVLTAAAAVIAIVAVVAGVVVALVAAWWLGVAVAAVVSAGSWFAIVRPRTLRAEERALVFVGPHRPARAAEHARLLNLVDGLAPSAGVTGPQVVILDDAAPNAVALGRDDRHGCIAVTTGLLAALDRMELEGVVARALAEIRDGATGLPTVALAIGGPGLLRRMGRPRTPMEADLAAVALTRYPPGLAGALRRLGAVGAGPSVAAADPVLAPYWLDGPDHEPSLAVRAGALEQL